MGTSQQGARGNKKGGVIKGKWAGVEELRLENHKKKEKQETQRNKKNDYQPIDAARLDAACLVRSATLPHASNLVYIYI